MVRFSRFVASTLPAIGVMAAGVILLVSAPISAQETNAGPLGADVSLGEAIFLHNWARPDQWTRSEPLGEGGDGLGPVYNDVSCIACHSVGGIGGAGDNDHNVELLSLVFPPPARSQRRMKLVQQAMTIHPQMAPDNVTLMLHHYGFGTDDDTYDYDSWRAAVATTAQKSQQKLQAMQPLAPSEVPLQLSQRNTPAVWGSGLIERLRRSGQDRLRQQIAVAQNGGNRGVSGRIPRTVDGQPGWYGWRGHVDHLPEFVMSACANELGLTVSNHLQPDSPRAERSWRRQAPKQDLTNSQVVALTRYVGSLPRPEQVYPTDPVAHEDAHTGERVFEATGCAECHIADFAFAKDIYSDFLLHDMGQSLSDPVAAFPENPPPRRSGRRGSYSGGSAPSPQTTSPRPTRLAHEWRTPPLWAVADTPPYMHDGRAKSLDEAIRLHDGEAQHAVTNYRYLSQTQRSQLLTFLGTLRAPQNVVAATNAGP